MIHQNLLLILTLFFAMTLLFLLSQKLKISYPIFLVIGGLAISLMPGMPVISGVFQGLMMKRYSKTWSIISTWKKPV